MKLDWEPACVDQRWGGVLQGLGCADVPEVNNGTLFDVLDLRLRVVGRFEDDSWFADLRGRAD